MVYESVSHIDELKKEIDDFIKINKLQINPIPVINGGFLQKYKINFMNNIILVQIFLGAFHEVVPMLMVLCLYIFCIF
jgi:hypothetical protein